MEATFLSKNEGISTSGTKGLQLQQPQFPKPAKTPTYQQQSLHTTTLPTLPTSNTPQPTNLTRLSEDHQSGDLSRKNDETSRDDK
ncbi:hypothetical protein AHAS_Ahas15G0211600 [Arachis hypogaea]